MDEEIFFFFVGLVAVTLVSAVFFGAIATIIAFQAKKRGLSWVKYFLLSFFLGAIGWLICFFLWRSETTPKAEITTDKASSTPDKAVVAEKKKPTPAASKAAEGTETTTAEKAPLFKRPVVIAVAAGVTLVFLVMTGMFALIGGFLNSIGDDVVAEDDFDSGGAIDSGWVTVSGPSGLTFDIPADWQLDQETASYISGSPDSGMVAAWSPEAEVFIWPLFIASTDGTPDPAIMLDDYAARLFPDLFPAAVALSDLSASTTATDADITYFLTTSLVPTPAGTVVYLYGGAANDLDAEADTFDRIINSVRIVGTPLGEGAGSGGLRFVTATDTEENSFSVQVPEGWYAELQVNRKSSSDFRPSVRLGSPDGSISVVWSGVSASNYHDKYAVSGLIIHGPGDVVTGLDGSTRIIRNPVGADTLVGEIVPAMGDFGQCGTASLTQIRPRDDIASIVRSQWTGFVVNADYSAAEGDFTCGDKVGRVMVVREVQSYAQFDPTLGSQMSLWGVKYFDGWVAPAEDEELAKFVLATIYETFTINPDWYSRQLNSDAALSQIVARSGQEISNIVSQGYADRNDYADSLSQRRSDATLGIERLDDPTTGRTYEVDSGSNYYWVDDRGTVVGTDTSVAPTIDFRQLIG